MMSTFFFVSRQNDYHLDWVIFALNLHPFQNRCIQRTMGMFDVDYGAVDLTYEPFLAMKYASIEVVQYFAFQSHHKCMLMVICVLIEWNLKIVSFLATIFWHVAL